MSYKDRIPYLRQLWLLLKFAVRRLFGKSGV